MEKRLPTGDGRGHGPDLGSDEWKSAVEYKLGVRGNPGVPDRGSDAWCRHIDRLVGNDPETSGKPAGGDTGSARGPSYACDRVAAGSVEAAVCRDEELSALDRKLSGVYAAATKMASGAHLGQLKAEQRGWIKGRNACWKSDDLQRCIGDEYRHRIAGLQARYRLVPGSGPVRFLCDGNRANEVVVTFFRTDPPTLIAERGDSVSLMYLQPGANGAQYRGRNESFRNREGEAIVTWGHGAPQMHCEKSP